MPRSPDISDGLVVEAASRAWFSFSFAITRQGFAPYGGEEFVIAGDGVEVLDEILASYDKQKFARIRMDFGSIVSDFRDVTREDVEAVKAAFIEVYGDVSKPDYYKSDWPIS